MTAVATAAGQVTRAQLVGHVSLSDPKYNASTEYGDNSSGIAAAMADAPAGGTVFVPDGTWTYTTPPSVTKPLTFIGESKYGSILLANGCNGIEVASGITYVGFRNLEIASAVRHTTTPNSLIGINVAGATGARPTGHIYEDVFIDGFQTGFQSAWLWSSNFRGFGTASGQYGMILNGLSVNNFASHLSLVGDQSANSRGIVIGDGTNATEGWVIGDSLIYGWQIGVEGRGATHCKVHHSIIDYCTNSGVVVSHAGSSFGGNWDIDSNYIAITGASGSAGVDLKNAVSNSQDRGCRVIGNEILTYAGSTALRGVIALGANSKNHNIGLNTINGFTAADIEANEDQGITIANNKCLSSITNNVIGGTYVHGNSGTQYYSRAKQKMPFGVITVTYDEAIPTQGTWKVGDICWRVNPSGSGVPGWVCTTAGTPGTWKTMPVLGA